VDALLFSHSHYFISNVHVFGCSGSEQTQYEENNREYTQNENKNFSSNDNVSNEFIQEENGLHIKYKRFVQATDNRLVDNITTTTNGKCPVTGAQFEQSAECPVKKSTRTVNEKKEKGYIHKVYEEQ
jgi:predicted DNA-binding WGR domain protein